MKSSNHLWLCASVLLAISAAAAQSPPPATTALSAPPAPMKLFIFSGQSNCVGHGDGDRLPDALKANDPNVLLFMRGYGFTPDWRPMTPYLTGDDMAKMYKTGKRQFGPEISFAYAMRERFPKHRIGVVKCAIGGTSVLAWSKDQGSPEWTRLATEAGMPVDRMKKDRPFYIDLLSIVRDARTKAGGEVEVAGFVWVQTEKDSMFPVAARDWAPRVVQLHRDLAADAKYSADIPLIVMAPHFHVFEKGPSEHATKILKGIRAASAGGAVDLVRLKQACELNALSDADFTKELHKMRCFVLPDVLRHIEGVGIMQRGLEEAAKLHANLRIARSEDLSTHEGLHFDTEGLIELGRRFAAAFDARGADLPRQSRDGLN